MSIGPVIFGETDQLITYLQRKNLLASNKTCPCGTAMQLSTRSDVSDGVRFRCPGCHKCTTIWEGSFFSESRLSLQKWVILMYWWARNYPVTDAAHEADVTECHCVCCVPMVKGSVYHLSAANTNQDGWAWHYKNHQLYAQMRGWEMLYFLLMYSTTVGEVLQQRVGYLLLPTTHTPALGYMELVPKRDAATLLPITQQHVLPGTIIWSDEWAAYNRVAVLPGVAGHEVVNHSLHFVDPTTGVNTQTVESYWNRIKRKFKRMMGVSSR